MNQTQPATADIFTRLSEQVAGMAAAAQPARAPFFAPLRDVDLPPPASMTTSAEQAALSPPEGQGEEYAAASSLWFAPLVPPDPARADDRVPSLDWLASTVHSDSLALQANRESVVAAPTTPALASPEPSEADALTPNVAAPAPTLTATDHADGKRSSPSSGLQLDPRIGWQPDHNSVDENEIASASRMSATEAGWEPTHDAVSETLLPAADERRTAIAPRGLTSELTSEAEDAHRPNTRAAGTSTTQGIPSTGSHGEPTSVSPTDLPPPGLTETQMPAGTMVVDTHGDATRPPVSETSSTPALSTKYQSVTSVSPASDAPPIAPQPKSNAVQMVDGSADAATQQGSQQQSGERRVTREGTASPRQVSPQQQPDVHPAVELPAGLSPQPTSRQPDTEERSLRGEETLPAEVAPRTAHHTLPDAEDDGMRLSTSLTIDADIRQEMGLPSATASAATSVQPAQRNRTSQALDDVGMEGRTQAPSQAQAEEGASLKLNNDQTAPEVRPGEKVNISISAPAPHPAEGSILPRHAQAQLEWQKEKPGTDLETARIQSSAAGPPATAESHSPAMRTRDGIATQPTTAPDAGIPAHTPVVQPTAASQSSPTQLAFRGDSTHGEMSHTAATTGANAVEALRPQRSASVGPDSSGERETMRQALTGQTSASPMEAQPTSATGAPASTAAQQRGAALIPRSSAQTAAAASVATEQPAVHPRLAQATDRIAVASVSGRQIEPEMLPTVHVTIGRVEVTFAARRTETAPVHQPSRQNLPLNAILQRNVWEVA